jgi:hypothetical protein
VAYSDAFGEAGTGGTGVFYLASAFDLILMQPTGTLSITGLAATSTFARGLLDRWKVQPVFFAREVGWAGGQAKWFGGGAGEQARQGCRFICGRQAALSHNLPARRLLHATLSLQPRLSGIQVCGQLHPE